jgi:hypothetical protein
MGNYNKLPIGIINMTSMNIDSASLLNKYVRGTYVKEMPDQTVRSFISQFQMIPVTMNFDCTIKVDSNLDQFKVADFELPHMDNVDLIINTSNTSVEDSVDQIKHVCRIF